MARTTHEDCPELFRAVIKFRYRDTPDAPTHPMYRGPYATAAAARAQIGRERREFTWHGLAEIVSVDIERAEVSWQSIGA